MKALFIPVACVLLLGCGGSRQSLVNLPAVSMSTKGMEAGATAEKIGPVSAEFCTGDDAISTTDSNVGLMDEVIARAEQQSGASYIADAQFSTKGSCIYLDGTAMKIVEGMAPAEESAPL